MEQEDTSTESSAPQGRTEGSSTRTRTGAGEEEEEEEAVVNLAKKWSGWKPKDEKERMKFRQMVLRTEDVTRGDVKSAGCEDDLEKVKKKGCGHSEGDDEELQEGKDVGSAR